MDKTVPRILMLVAGFILVAASHGLAQTNSGLFDESTLKFDIHQHLLTVKDANGKPWHFPMKNGLKIVTSNGDVKEFKDEIEKIAYIPPPGTGSGPVDPTNGIPADSRMMRIDYDGSVPELHLKDGDSVTEKQNEPGRKILTINVKG